MIVGSAHCAARCGRFCGQLMINAGGLRQGW
jgi:hypothetical protein